MPNETKACLNYKGEYHRLLESKNALEEQYKTLENALLEANQEIAFLKGQVKAFEFCVAKGK